MLKIGVLCPFHAPHGFRLIADQLLNYSSFLQHSECTFVMHPSLQTPREGLYEKLAIFCSNKHSLIITPESVPTSQHSTIDAICSLTESISSGAASELDVIYYHTDSDFLFRTDAEKLMTAFDYAVYADPARLGQSDWMWKEKMLSNRLINDFMARIGITQDELFSGGIECSFYPVSLWLEIIGTIKSLKLPSGLIFDAIEDHWPAEEILIPTLAKAYASKLNLTSYGKSLCFRVTHGFGDEFVSIKNLQELLAEDAFYAAKRISPDEKDPVRWMLSEFIRRLD